MLSDAPCSRRTRSVPRPNLIEEDTLFATDKDFKVVTVGGREVDTVTMTSFSQTSFSSWKDSPPPPTRNVQDNVFSQNFSTNNAAMRLRNSLSVSVDEDSRTLNKAWGIVFSRNMANWVLPVTRQLSLLF